ncbi:MAG: rhodanese-like domain-containing protein [Deltaproteobacteria bacterium]|nr:rhodanese-like domain-containing protein [Deltaproteobacteria bacterium]
MKRWWKAAVSAVVILTGTALAESRDVGASEAAALIEANKGKASFAILDLRTPREFADERIAGSLLVDFLAPTFRQELAKLDRGKTYLVYCRTGNRSGKALKSFEELAFRDVVHLSTGIVGWKEAGLATVR